MTERSEPTFFVLVKQLGKQKRERVKTAGVITSFEYQDEESKTDLLKLGINNQDLDNFNVPLWRPGNMVAVSWGYPGNMAPIREMTITKVGGSTLLTVEAQGAESKMNLRVKQRRFENMTRSQVAAAIAADHGYMKARQWIEDTAVREETIVQSGETDLQFMRRLAEVEGFEFFADVDGLHFHARKLGQKPIKEVRWFLPQSQKPEVKGAVGDIIGWSLESDIYDVPTGKPGKVTLRGRDPITKKSFTVVASDRDTARNTLSSVPLVPDVEMGEALRTADVAKELVARTSQTSEAAAKREADGIYVKSMLAVEIKMTLIGDPDIRSKSIISVSGITQRLSGLYYVKSSRHMLSGGYTTEVTLASDGVEQHVDDKTVPALATVRQQSQGAKNSKTPPTPQEAGKLEEQTVTTPDGQVTQYLDTQGKEL